MRLVSWNVNGIRAVHRRGDLAWAFAGDADVVCLQETKVDADHVPPELNPPSGWQCAYAFGERRGYSGVATFVREGLMFDVVAKGLGEPRLDGEGRVVCSDHGAFLLFNIYFPNGGRGEERHRFKMDFYEKFHAVVRAHRDAGREVVVCGDVNTAHRPIDIAEPEANLGASGFREDERAFLDAFLADGFIDTFRAEHGDRPDQYTWWDVRRNDRLANIGWRIDYFFISEGLEDVFVDAWISPQISGSDHCPIGLELELEA